MSCPACDAHITASTRSSSPSASSPPEATSGSAWNGFADERSVVTRSGSPHDAITLPSRRTATAWTRCRLSGNPFRYVVTTPVAGCLAPTRSAETQRAFAVAGDDLTLGLRIREP